MRGATRTTKISRLAYAQLTLNAERLSAQYVDLDGTVVFSEAWTVTNGALQRAA